jgi:hypothetical protein
MFFFRKNHHICLKPFVNSGNNDECKLEHQNMADVNLLMYFDIKSVDSIGYCFQLTVIQISWQNCFQFCRDLFCSFPMVLLTFSCRFFFLLLSVSFFLSLFLPFLNLNQGISLQKMLFLKPLAYLYQLTVRSSYTCQILFKSLFCKKCLCVWNNPLSFMCSTGTAIQTWFSHASLAEDDE